MSAPAPRLAPGFLLLFVPFVAGYFVSFFLRYVNAVIAADLTAELYIGPAELALLTSVFFFSFALVQLPLGIALDRWGPRRVVSALMLVAAAGFVVFGSAQGFATLTLGRALTGLGVSGCLMGALKAFRTWIPVERLATVTGIFVMVGGAGGIFATAPTEWLVSVVGWRVVFFAMAAVATGIAFAIFAIAPEESAAGKPESFRDLVSGMALIGRDRRFWWIVLPFVLTHAPYTAFQSLWFGPWLRDAGGMGRGEAANLLLVAVIGYFGCTGFVGVLADRLARSGLPHRQLFAIGTAVSLALLVWLTQGPAGWRGPLLVLYAISITFSGLGMPLIPQLFPASMAGRANTAHNALMFISVFALQAGFGALLTVFADRDAADAYRYAFGVIALVQACALYFSLTLHRVMPASPARSGAGNG